jgi:hypothetical protein
MSCPARGTAMAASGITSPTMAVTEDRDRLPLPDLRRLWPARRGRRLISRMNSHAARIVKSARVP